MHRGATYRLQEAEYASCTLVQGEKQSSSAHSMAVCAQVEEATAAEGHAAATTQRTHMEQSLQAALADSSSAGTLLSGCPAAPLK